MPLKYVLKGVQGPPCRGLTSIHIFRNPVLSGIVKGGKPLTWGLGLCPNFLFFLFYAAAGGTQQERKEAFEGAVLRNMAEVARLRYLCILVRPRQRAAPFAIPLI